MDIILQNLRQTAAGHFRLLPNINVSSRPFPPEVSAGDLQANSKLDNERPVRKLTDKELYCFTVDISPQEWAAHPRMTLEASYNPALFKLLSASAIPLASQGRQPVMVDLARERSMSTKSSGIQMFLEAQTFWGSPLVDASRGDIVKFRILDASGAELLSRSDWNGTDLRTADVILIGDDAPPERIFMCELAENQPSVRELREAIKNTGVPLTLVPQDVGMGDVWLQDQFQIGYTATPEGEQTVIVHLPRMRHSSALFPGTANLRNFTDTHFPSQTISVVKDFWRLTTTINDGDSTPLTLQVAQSYALHRQLSSVFRLRKLLLSLLMEIDPKARFVSSGPDIFGARLDIDKLHAMLLSFRNLKPEQETRVLGIKEGVDIVSQSLEIRKDAVILIVRVDGPAQEFTFREDNRNLLQEFLSAIDAIHSSRNYGGNIEVSPPHAAAPYGKILAGSITSKGLREFLTSRGSLHPYAEATTEWLDVGHIDEIAAFARRGQGDFCVLRASPKLGLDILDRLVACQAQGVSVTRLFRGKKWIHEFQPGATDPFLPPGAYRRLLASGQYDLSGFAKKIPVTPKPTFGDAVYHDDRQFLVFNTWKKVSARYAAMISCADLLKICRTTNRAAEVLFLTKSTYELRGDSAFKPYLNDQNYSTKILPRRLEKVLDDEFPGKAVYPLPAVFDWVQDFLHASTSAIIPGMVNMQALGSHVLIPRPFGARMPVANAVVFINELLSRLDFPKAKIDEKFIRSRDLDKTWHWTRVMEGVHRAELQHDPTDFDPQYHEYLVSKFLPTADSPDLYQITHQGDPLSNHPKLEYETLGRIAGYFKDGFPQFKNIPVDFCNGDTEQSHPRFDKYESDLKSVMKLINDANPGVFDQEGKVIPEDWTRIVIPEDTTDVFELYTQILLEALGLTVHWVDSWYYHVRIGEIHCGTNVLRSFAGRT